MKKILKITAILLILAGSFACQKNNADTDENTYIPTNPQEAILGKWELVALELLEDQEPYKPTGYVEYLTDSIFGWYDYASKKYTQFDDKYWLDSIDTSNQQLADCLILHYEKNRERENGQYEYYPDKPLGCNNFECIFVSNNRVSLWQIDHLTLTEEPKYIYKRIK